MQIHCECGKSYTVSDEWAGKKAKCKVCGGSIAIPPLIPNAEQTAIELDDDFAPQKSRLKYILLAFFLGGFGIHNHYAGYTKRGIAQFAILFGGFWLIIPALAVCVWIWYEIFTVTHDADGIPFGDDTGLPAIPQNSAKWVSPAKQNARPRTQKTFSPRMVMQKNVSLKKLAPRQPVNAIKIVGVICGSLLLAFMFLVVVAVIVGPSDGARNSIPRKAESTANEASKKQTKTSSKPKPQSTKPNRPTPSGSLQDRYNRVQVGMKEQQMLNIMGTDYSIISDASSQIPGVNVRMKSYQWGGFFGMVHIHVQNGRVSQKIKM